MQIKPTQLFDIFSKLRFLLARKHKAYLIVLYFLTLTLSIIETVGVSIIMPFITLASNPDRLDKGRYNAIFNFLGFTDKTNFIVFFGLCIVAFYLFRSAFNVFYTYILNRFALGTYTYLAKKLYSKYLSISYKMYVQKNQSELLQGISQANSVSTMLLSLLNIFSDIFIVLMLYTFMVIANWQMTAVLTIVLSTLIFVILKFIVKKNKKLGAIAAEENRILSKVIGESRGNFKIVKLKGSENYNYKRFENATQKISHTQVISTTLGSMPRSILESAGFSLLIVSVLFIIVHTGSAETIIPIIAMYALGLYRILPTVNKMLTNISSVSFLQSALDIVYSHATEETDEEGCESIEFNNNIKLENVCFKYLTGNEVLHNINLEIKKGEKIAFTGNSGGGKSTLADILIGIQKPVSGTFSADGIPINNSNIRNWRSRIGYIPQSIYLFDDTVAENVVFGSPYNEQRLIEVLKMARIWDFLKEKDGLNTRMGDDGIHLSGGQKQRVGIARALYTDPDIILLDEATSALDNETESQIMEEIYNVGKNKTLIIVAHRLSTIEKCDRRIVVDNGNIGLWNVQQK